MCCIVKGVKVIASLSEGVVKESKNEQYSTHEKPAW